MTPLTRNLARNAFLLAAAGAGGYIGFCDAPGSWSADWRAVAAGVVGFAFAYGLPELLASPLPALRTLAAGPDATAVPATLADGIHRLDAAVADDAAQRAAEDAVPIDFGRMFLADADRWQGYRDGTATFFLAPGAYLRYWRDTQFGEDTPGVVFTIITSDADAPVRVTDLRQLRRLLESYATRAAGTPGSKDTDLQTA